MTPQHATTPAPRIAVIGASRRAEGTGRALASWVRDRVGADADLIDLAEIDLPDDAGLLPGGHTTIVSQRLAAADGFVFVVPEYNHSYPAALKRLIDWHHPEWKLKAATIVAYGVYGGYSAIEHLRGVLAELNVVTTRRVLGLPAPWQHIDADGYRVTPDTQAALDALLAEFRWWSTLLADARRTGTFPG